MWGDFPYLLSRHEQERTDEMLRLVDAGDYLAMVGEDAGDG